MSCSVDELSIVNLPIDDLTATPPVGAIKAVVVKYVFEQYKTAGVTFVIFYIKYEVIYVNSGIDTRSWLMVGFRSCAD